MNQKILLHNLKNKNGKEGNEDARRCPNCSAHLADDSLFCSECGTPISEGNVCPHCGAVINENNTTKMYYDEEKSPLKRYLPYILGALVFLMVCGGGYWWYSNSNDSTLDRNTLADLIRPTIDAQYEDLISVVKKSSTKRFYADFKSRCNRADKKGEERPRIWWQQSDSDPESFNIEKIEMLSSSEAIAELTICSEMCDGKFDVTLKLEDDNWKIDGIKEQSLINHPLENVDESNPYSDYIGEWTHYITHKGQRLRVMTAIINEDMSGEIISYEDGEIVYPVVHFEQCMFKNGYVYFTNDGDITKKKTPCFQFDSDGLRTFNGEEMVRE